MVPTFRVEMVALVLGKIGCALPFKGVRDSPAPELCAAIISTALWAFALRSLRWRTRVNTRQRGDEVNLADSLILR
jgi:hypothetical protein